MPAFPNVTDFQFEELYNRTQNLDSFGNQRRLPSGQQARVANDLGLSGAVRFGGIGVPPQRLPGGSISISRPGLGPTIVGPNAFTPFARVNPGLNNPAQVARGGGGGALAPAAGGGPQNFIAGGGVQGAQAGGVQQGGDPRAANAAAATRRALLEMLGQGSSSGGAAINAAKRRLRSVASGRRKPFGKATVNRLLGRELSAAGAAQERAQSRTQASLASRGLSGGGIENAAINRIAGVGAEARQDARGRILPMAAMQNFFARQQAATQLGALGASQARTQAPFDLQAANILAQTQFRGGGAPQQRRAPRSSNLFQAGDPFVLGSSFRRA